VRGGAALAGSLGPALLRGLARTWRFREVAPDGAVGAPCHRVGRALYAIWHRQLLMLTLRHRDEGIAVMVSRSRDGELAARITAGLGYLPIRGSSSSGGGEAIREMVEAAGRGRSLALTVDGPRGPSGVCKPGAALIAARWGGPVVPTGAFARRAWIAGTWDRFVIPRPGTEIFVAYGEPIDVDTDGSAEDVARWQQRIGASIDAATRRCELASSSRSAGSTAAG
jgi:lysophospholipid acyltransferase (LPLAT)-like uncharacterized protein